MYRCYNMLVDNEYDVANAIDELASFCFMLCRDRNPKKILRKKIDSIWYDEKIDNEYFNENFEKITIKDLIDYILYILKNANREEDPYKIDKCLYFVRGIKNQMIDIVKESKELRVPCPGIKPKELKNNLNLINNKYILLEH